MHLSSQDYHALLFLHTSDINGSHARKGWTPATTRIRRTLISETARFSVEPYSVVQQDGFNMLNLKHIRSESTWPGQKVAWGIENAAMKRV